MSVSVLSRGVAPLAGLVAVLTLPSGALATTSTWSFRGGSFQLQYYNPELGGWDVASTGLTADSASTANGVKLFGTGPDSNDGSTNVFNLTGSTYIPGAGDGEFRGMRLIAISDGWLDPNWNSEIDSIVTAFKFNVKTSGGTLNVYNVQTDYGLNDAKDNLLYLVGSSGFSTSWEPGENGADFQYVDGFGGENAGQGVHVIGDFVINFEWTGMGESDTLEWNIPKDSIDINQVSTPAPGAAALFGVAGFAAARRRRS